MALVEWYTKYFWYTEHLHIITVIVIFLNDDKVHSVSIPYKECAKNN